jgi:hypothetical protein
MTSNNHRQIGQMYRVYLHTKTPFLIKEKYVILLRVIIISYSIT